MVQVVNDRISVSQPVSVVRRSLPSASTTKNSAHSTAHCSQSRPIVGSWNLTMLVMPNAVAMIATQAEYQPSPVAGWPARLLIPTYR